VVRGTGVRLVVVALRVWLCMERRGATMASKRKRSIQPLEECIKTLELLPGFQSMPLKEAAEVYVASLAFCHHLAVDQNIISCIRYVFCHTKI
jgi:hypothetical protein